MPCNGCSALHGVNPNLKERRKQTKKKQTLILGDSIPKGILSTSLQLLGNLKKMQQNVSDME